MFSALHISTYFHLCQRQWHCLFDTPNSTIHQNYSPKTKFCHSISCSLNVPPISDSLPSTPCSHVDDRSYHELDASTAGHWLQSCTNIMEVRKVHAFVIKCMRDPEVYVNNNLISMYVKLGNLVLARRVFDAMVQRNVISWTAMLNGYQRHSMGDESLILFIDFISRGFTGNAQTHACLFNLCSRIFNFELGRQLHARVIKNWMSNPVSDCTILQFYARCGDLDSAFKVFDQIQERDLIVWTTMITACSQHKQGKEAFILLSEMLFNRLDPNEFTLCSVLNACGEEKELPFGKQIHAVTIKKAYDMDVYIGTSLVDMYAKCGKIEESRALFDGMKKKNAITWTSIISGYARNGLGEEAISLFRVMTRLKIPENNLTMVSILRACGLLRSLSTGREVHAQILKEFSPSNIFIGSALVWLYFKCGDYTSASRVLQNLPDKDVVSWTAMISGCSNLGHEQEALEYLKAMLGDGVKPNPFTYSSALKACTKLESIKQGKVIHSSINKTLGSSNVFVGSALVHMYSKFGYLSEAVQIFNNMPEKNLVLWKAMTVAYARNGHCGEALKLMHQMQAEGIEVDDYILSTVLTACGDFKWREDSSPEQVMLS